MSQFLSLLFEDVALRMKEMGTEQLRPFLRPGIAMELYCQKEERGYHMFRLGFLNRKLPK